MKLTQLRPTTLLMILLVGAVAGWLAAFITAEQGWPAPVLGLVSVITVAAVVVILIVLGIRVLRDRARPVADRMNPLAAAQTLVLAQAGAYAGSLISGWHIGVLLHRLPATGWGTDTATDSVMMVITGLTLIVVGYVVEQWCRIPPDDDADQGGPSGRNAPPPTTPGVPQAGRYTN